MPGGREGGREGSVHSCLFLKVFINMHRLFGPLAISFSLIYVPRAHPPPHSLSCHLPDSHHIPADCPAHVKHPVDIFLVKPIAGPLTIPRLSTMRLCVRSPLGPALIRPADRTDGLARTSLKPIRCTERETASPSSIMLYMSVVGENGENTERLCVSRATSTLHPCPPLSPFLSSPISSSSAPCLHSI